MEHRILKNKIPGNRYRAERESICTLQKTKNCVRKEDRVKNRVVIIVHQKYHKQNIDLPYFLEMMVSITNYVYQAKID